ncbi:unnamed protein product [Rotaria sp. Silwood1]|nr:unnamed protein product [Rotaria sp. Silwood1]
MARHNDFDSESTVIQHTTNFTEIAINADQLDRKSNDYVPYPPKNFNDPLDELHQQVNMFSVAHIYDQDGWAFVPNVPIHILSIVAERISTTSTKFPNLHLAQDENNEWPSFPISKDKLTAVNDNIDHEFCQILCDYLNKVVSHPKCRNHPSTYEFFEVSCLSFARGMAVSLKEGYLLKQPSANRHGHNVLLRLPFICNAYPFHHKRKWFAVKDSFVTYVRPDTHEVRFPMLVDRGFEVLGHHRNSNTNYGIEIINLQRTLRVKCETVRDYEEWMQSLNVLKEKAHCFANDSDNRFHSFAPIRHNQLGYWYLSSPY